MIGGQVVAVKAKHAAAVFKFAKSHGYVGRRGSSRRGGPVNLYGRTKMFAFTCALCPFAVAMIVRM